MKRDHADPQPASCESPGLSRRSFLGSAAGLAAGLAASAWLTPALSAAEVLVRPGQLLRRGHPSYRLYLAESGDHSHRRADAVGKRYLCLLGCAVEQQWDRLHLQPNLESLKQGHFSSGPGEPIVLHREDLLRRRGPFWRLRDGKARSAWERDLLGYLGNQEYTVFAVVLDKHNSFARRGSAAWHPYRYCLGVLLGRYAGWLLRQRASGDVVAMARGRVEDHELGRLYQELRAGGLSQLRTALTGPEMKFKGRLANLAGLQLAGLLAYPCKMDVLVCEGRIPGLASEFTRAVVKTVQSKYARPTANGEVRGYGRQLV